MRSLLISKRHMTPWIVIDAWIFWRHTAWAPTSFGSSDGFGTMQKWYVEQAVFLANLLRLDMVPPNEAHSRLELSTRLSKQL